MAQGWGDLAQPRGAADYLFEKVRNLSVLDGATTKRHDVLHIGAHLVAKGVLGHMGQIHLISTYENRGNWPIF